MMLSDFDTAILTGLCPALPTNKQCQRMNITKQRRALVRKCRNLKQEVKYDESPKSGEGDACRDK